MGSKLSSAGEIELAMHPDEIEMLERHLRPGIAYLEFGAGGSTRLALAHGVTSCHSVESDPVWIEKLRQDQAVREAEAIDRLRFHPIDLGPLLTWGMPADKSRIEHWQSYFLAVWDRLPRDPDLVLIDGRFRTACGLVALALCEPRATVLMHDFFDPLAIRKNYRTLLEVADIAEQAGQLVSLRRKKGLRPRNLIGRLPAVWTDFA